MLEVSGDTNHAGASLVTPPHRSKGLRQEPQPVPGLPGDFKACWPSRSGVCRDETHLSIFASPDTDLLLWKLLIRVIRAPVVTPPLSVTSGRFSKGSTRLPLELPRGARAACLVPSAYSCLCGQQGGTARPASKKQGPELGVYLQDAPGPRL